MHIGRFATLALALSLPLGCGLDCPEGTERRGASPPDGHEQHCATPEGTKLGPFRTWHHGGELASEGSYHNGVLDELVVEWWPSGQKKSEHPMRQGRHAEGLHREWWPNGQLRERFTVRTGSKHGAMETWHENGQKAVVATYGDRDRRDGEEVHWNDKGEVISRANYRRGEAHGTFWKLDEAIGPLPRRCTFRDGVRTSPWVEVLPGGGQAVVHRDGRQVEPGVLPGHEDAAAAKAPSRAELFSAPRTVRHFLGEVVATGTQFPAPGPPPVAYPLDDPAQPNVHVDVHTFPGLDFVATHELPVDSRWPLAPVVPACTGVYAASAADGPPTFFELQGNQLVSRAQPPDRCKTLPTAANVHVLPDELVVAAHGTFWRMPKPSHEGFASDPVAIMGADSSALVALGRDLYALEDLRQPRLRSISEIHGDRHRMAGDPKRRRAFVASWMSGSAPRSYLTTFDLAAPAAYQNIADLGPGTPRGLHYLPDPGVVLYWGGEPARTLVVDPDTGKTLHSFDGSAGPLRILSPGPSPLVVVQKSVFDIRTGAKRGELPDLSRYSPAIVQDGRHLAYVTVPDPDSGVLGEVVVVEVQAFKEVLRRRLPAQDKATGNAVPTLRLEGDRLLVFVRRGLRKGPADR